MADRVVVWLGEVVSEQSEGVHEIVQRIAKHIRGIRAEGGFDETSMEGYDSLQISEEHINTTAREVLRRLYAMPWFSRIWCVQEIVLAKDAIMLWGKHELSWKDVGMIATWLHAVIPVRALEFDTDAFYADIEADHAYDMYRFQRKPHDLLELLSEIGAFKASNPRDRVYGVLALVEPKEEAQALCVDYDKSVGEVYTDTVVAWIQLHADLTPLSYVDHGPTYQQSCQCCRSWTPKWHLSQGPRRLPAEGSPLSASKDIPVKWVDASKVNSQCLRLRGMLYSEITNVHVLMDHDSLQDYKKHPFLDNYYAIVGQPDPHVAEVPPVSYVLARTLTAGCNSAMDDILNASMEEQVTFYTSFLMLIYSLQAGLDYITLRKEFSPQESFYNEAEIVCTERRLFQTRNGNFGLGPGSTKKGDIVAVLYGGDTPYILRPYDESYLFIGQAYIDDLMQGELIDEMEAGRAHEQEFCLV